MVPVFPKTSQLARYHALQDAGRRVHDEHIGVGNVFHLFRLPEEVEQDLHQLMHEKQMAGGTVADLENKQIALRALATIADGTRAATEGPIAIGKVDDLLTTRAWKGIAQTYCAAFEHATKTYPYLIG